MFFKQLTMKSVIYLLLIVLISCAGKNPVLENNDIKIEVLSYDKIEKKLKLKVSNNTSDNLWFDIGSLNFCSASIYDDKDNLINNLSKYKFLPSEEPNFILLNGNSSIELTKSIEKMYNYVYMLEKGNKYIIKFIYYNDYSDKKDRQVKTFRGKITNIKSFEFVY